MTVAMINIAAVAIRRIRHPLPAKTAGIAILHGVWSADTRNRFNRS